MVTGGLPLGVHPRYRPVRSIVEVAHELNNESDPRPTRRVPPPGPDVDSPSTEGQVLSHLRSTGGQNARASAPRAPQKLRLPPPPSSLRGRFVIAAVAIGAFGAAGAGQTLQAVADGGASTDEVTPLANATKASENAAAFGIGGTAPAAPQILQVAKHVDPSAEASKLTKSQRITEQREAEE